MKKPGRPRIIGEHQELPAMLAEIINDAGA